MNKNAIRSGFLIFLISFAAHAAGVGNIFADIAIQAQFGVNKTNLASNVLGDASLFRSIQSPARLVTEQGFTEISLKLVPALSQSSLTRHFLAQLDPAVRFRLGALLGVIDTERAAKSISVEDIALIFQKENRPNVRAKLEEAGWFKQEANGSWKRSVNDSERVEKMLGKGQPFFEGKRIANLAKLLSPRAVAEIAEILGLIGKPEGKESLMKLEDLVSVFRVCRTKEAKKGYLAYEIMNLHRWMSTHAMRGYRNSWVPNISVSGSSEALMVSSRLNGPRLVSVTEAGVRFRDLAVAIKALAASENLFMSHGDAMLAFGGDEIALSSEALSLLNDQDSIKWQLYDINSLAAVLEDIQY